MLKWPFMAALLLTTATVHRQLAGSRTRALLAFALWSFLPCVLAFVLTLLRHDLAPLLSGSATKFYSLASTPIGGSLIHDHYMAWQNDWTHGTVLLAESLFLVFLAALNALLALSLGSRPGWSVPIAVIASEGSLLAYMAWSPWFLADFGFFVGDIFVTSLPLDHISVVAADPHTTLAMLPYAAIFIGHVLVLRLASHSPKRAA